MIPLPGDPRKSTEATKFAVAEINAQFGAIGSMGIYNRRDKDSGGWSQHSWGNAVDPTSPLYMEKPPLYASEYTASLPRYEMHMAYMDNLYDWLIANRVNLQIKWMGWRRYMHYNHIHIDFYPHMEGTPPILEPYNEEDEESMKQGDEGPRVVTVQERLLKLGYELPQWGADGDFGDETVLAVKAWQTAKEADADGVLQAIDMHVLFEGKAKDTYARKLARSAHERLNKIKEVL